MPAPCEAVDPAEVPVVAPPGLPMVPERRAQGRTFRSLRNRNYRLYFTGQLISQIGTFMQLVGQAWLVLDITGSGSALGLVVTLQYLPSLLLAGLVGLCVDRLPRRRLYVVTQSLGGLAALVLGVLTVTDVVELWMVYVLAGLLGVITAFDQTTKTTLMLDIVEPDDVTNAVGLNMALTNAGRVLGPALAGVIISALGMAACFLLNAASFGAVLVAIALMRSSELRVATPQARAKGQLLEGFDYVRRTPNLLAILALCSVLFAFAWEWEVFLPLLARESFGGGAGMFSTFLALVGIGAVVGAIYMARHDDPSPVFVGRSSALFALALLAAGVSPHPILAGGFLAMAGAVGTASMACASATLQVQSAPELRGRVMALWIVAAVGSRPLGAPLVGWVSERFGPRYGMALGATIVLLVGVPLWEWLRQRAPTTGLRTGTMAKAPLPGHQTVGSERARSLPTTITTGVPR